MRTIGRHWDGRPKNDVVSLQVTPVLSELNLRHHVLAEAVASGGDALEFATPGGSDIANLLDRQLTTADGGAGCVAIPAASDSVLDIVVLGTEFEMARVTAWRIVASVAYDLALWRESVEKYVYSAMGPEQFSVDADYAVSKRVSVASPGPTGVISARTVDSVPEFRDGNRRRHSECNRTP